MEIQRLGQQVDIALRRQPADLVIKQVRIFDLATGEFRQADIAVGNDKIAAVGQGYEGKTVIDGAGLTAVPGFVDAHCHIESSMLAPIEWSKAVLQHGTTVAVCDPHELANVAGAAGIDFFLESAQHCPIELQVQIPSCVPALPSEEAGAVLDAQALKPYATVVAPRALRLAEMMNVPGILQKDPDVLQKLADFGDHPIDGHAPLVSGEALQALCAVGVANDHESSNVDEALEKLRAGMMLFLRCGSMARDLPRLTSLLNLTLCDRLCLCTDDREPLDILEEGHIDAAIRLAIQAGCDPLAVYRAACLTPAKAFQWQHRGLIAPGSIADIVLLSDVNDCRVAKVIRKGQLVTEEMLATFTNDAVDVAPFYASVHCKTLTADDFGEPTERADLAIGVEEGNIITQCVSVASVAKETLSLVALVARHGKSDRIGRAWAHGFNLQRGAIASTIGHDSHNLCVVGTNPADMAVAANALRTCGGGFAVAIEGKLVACLPLPIGGLMSPLPIRDVAEQLTAVRAAALKTGTTLTAPLMTLAFLPLPVIPFARLTLDGLVTL